MSDYNKYSLLITKQYKSASGCVQGHRAEVAELLIPSSYQITTHTQIQFPRNLLKVPAYDDFE